VIRSTSGILLAMLVIAVITFADARADDWSFLPKDEQVACGLQKLTDPERRRLLELFTIAMSVDDLEQSAREYVEDELGLSSEVYVTKVSGEYLVLDSGRVLKMWSAYSFEAFHRYLADDDYQPDKILDHDGNVQDVWEVYDDVEEALGDE